MFGNYYTIDDLHQFCKNNAFTKFSSKEKGAPLIIQSIGNFEASESNNSLMPVKLKSCHTGKNRNKSGITDETMNKYKDTFKGKPILGSIYKTDTGEYEFRSHDMKLVENEDGETEVEYIEKPVGVISEVSEPYLEYDKDEDKSYLMVEGNIFTNYSKAAEILQRRKTCKCSVEIAVEEMSYNCDEDYLSIDAFEFLGVTILGYEQDGVTEIQEGMKGSKITIEDFGSKNSMNYDCCQQKLIETLDELNKTLKSFNKTNDEEGGESEMLEDEVIVEEEVEVTETPEVVVESSEDPIPENDVPEMTGEEDPVTFTKSLKFEISHEDIRYALYNLISSFDEEDNEWYFIDSVFDDYFYMRGMYENKIYKLGYAKSGDNVELVGDRQEMFELILTESEKMAIEEMRSNYEAINRECEELRTYKSNVETAALKAEKEAIFNDEKYASIKNTNAFKNIVENSENYSVDECRSKMDSIFDDFSSYAANFSYTEKEDPKILSFGAGEKKNEKKKPYGGLFEE